MKRLLQRIDIGRLLLAVLIAFALYGAVRAEQNPPETGTFDVPVDIDNVPAGLVRLNPELTTVRIRVSAPRDEWVSLRPSSFRAFLQLSRGTSGVDEYPVMVEVPDPKVRVVEVVPPRVPVRLDENVDRSVPIRLVRTGAVPFGYEAGEPEVDPPSVTMSGPASVVRKVEAMTVEVRLDAATVDIDRSASPSPVDSQGQPVTFDNRMPVRINPAGVKVRVPITQQLSYKTVGLQPELTGTPRSGYVITGVTAEPATVTLVGAPRALAAVNTANTEPIDVSDASTTFTRQVGVGVAEGLSVVQQETVRVTVRISPIVLSQSFTTVPVPDNLGAGVQITSALPSVQVVLQGPASSLQNLRATDLRASLNLAGLAAGTHQINVEVAAPPGITTQSVSPRIVPVTLVVVTPPTPVPEPTQPPPPTPTPEPTAVRTEPIPTVTVSDGEADRG